MEYLFWIEGLLYGIAWFKIIMSKKIQSRLSALIGIQLLTLMGLNQIVDQKSFLHQSLLKSYLNGIGLMWIMLFVMQDSLILLFHQKD
jgi:hypothetical protein